jgi:L-iditol 2-dehydrogenase
MKQRASVLSSSRTITMEERDVPTPAPHEILVEVKSVGICGSDIHYFEHGRIGSFIVDGPLILGHEASGQVVAVGADITDIAPGTRVALEPGVPCKKCEQCRAGRYNLCPDVIFFATPPVDGAFTQFVALDRDFVHPVPDHVSYDAAALMEPLSVGIWANRKAGTTTGSRVLITGAGPIGMVCALVARTSGASEVTVTDINTERLARAAAQGFTTVHAGSDEVATLTDFTVLIECSGATTAIGQGIRALGPAGTAVLVGMAAEGNITLPVDVIQGREIWLTGTFRYANTYPTAVDLVSSGAIDLDPLVSKIFTLDEVGDALSYYKQDPAAMKVVVRVSE